MSVGPLGGIIASAAGTPLAQTQGSEIDRAAQETAAQQRQVKNDLKAEAAAGVAETDGEDKETEERDADGRRLWEAPAEGEHEQAEAEDQTKLEAPRSKDPTGQCGSHLDLSG